VKKVKLPTSDYLFLFPITICRADPVYRETNGVFGTTTRRYIWMDPRKNRKLSECGDLVFQKKKLVCFYTEREGNLSGGVL
jgi:hypothetical protein